MAKKICILGGGFGGLYTALYLSRSAAIKSEKWEITLVEPKDNFLFTPLLYELITGELQRWEIAPSYQKLLRNTKIKLCQVKAKDINFIQAKVALENGQTLNYNYLVLAVGCKNRWANIPGLRENALTFRTVEDVEYLQARLHLLEATEKQKIQLAVIGGGPNGVELACKLADKLGKRGQVRLIERGDNILKGFSHGVRSASWKALSKRKVEVNINTNVEAISADKLTLTKNEQKIQIDTDLVIWAAGIQSREWIVNLDCQKTPQGKLLTSPSLQLIDYPEVFVLGDIAEIRSSKTRVPATAQAAYQQASCVAKNILLSLEGKSLKSFRYLHLGDMLTLGKRSAIVSCFFLNIEGRLADIIRRLAYILRLPTFRHRLQVLKSLFSKLGMKIKRLFRVQINQLLSFISE